MAEPTKTIISSHARFAAGADLVAYRDWRMVGDLLLDTDARPADSATTVTLIDTTDSPGDRALKAASATIESACYRGKRYTRADLQKMLTSILDDDGNGFTVAREMLRQLTCDIAFWILTKRRKPDADPRRVAGVPEAFATLEALRLGEAIFPFSEVGDAAAIDIAPFDPNVSKTAYRFDPLSNTSIRMFGTRSRSLR